MGVGVPSRSATRLRRSLSMASPSATTASQYGTATRSASMSKMWLRFHLSVESRCTRSEVTPLRRRWASHRPHGAKPQRPLHTSSRRSVAALHRHQPGARRVAADNPIARHRKPSEGQRRLVDIPLHTRRAADRCPRPAPLYSAERRLPSTRRTTRGCPSGSASTFF
jgi:hypothetical protein